MAQPDSDITTKALASVENFGAVFTTLNDLRRRKFYRAVKQTQSKPFTRPLNYSLYVHRENFYVGQYGYGNDSGIYKVTGPLGTASVFDSFPPIAHDPHSDRKAIAKLLNNLNDSELDLAVDIAELRKTESMVVKRVEQVIDIARKARKKAIRRFFRRKKSRQTQRRWDRDLGNAWLEYNYGWRPAISSIYNAAQFARKKSALFWVQGKGITRDSSIYEGSRFYASVTESVRVDVTTTTKYAFRVALANQTYSDLSRLTSLNPAAIFWELVPYSFVVDWFIDIGGYLRNLQTAYAAGVVVHTGYKVQTTKRRAAGFVFGGTRQGNYFNFANAVASGDQILYERFVQASLPVPYLPTLDVQLGWRRLLSGAALISNLCKKPHTATYG